MDKLPRRKKLMVLLMVFTIIVMFFGGCKNSKKCLMDEPFDNHGEMKVISSSDYYILYDKSNLYYYTLFDNNRRPIKSGGPFSKEPKISACSDFLLRISIQGGTGIATQSAFYYNVNNGKISDVFPCVFDEHNDLVVYCRDNRVIVQNIFDCNEYYRMFSAFQKPFAAVAFPLVDVSISEDGQSITVIYLSGEDYEEITETVDLGDGTQGDV